MICIDFGNTDLNPLFNEYMDQLTLYDFGLNDNIPCDKCIWKLTYGYCYPKEYLHRQYYYISNDERKCSDYSSKFVSLK